METILKEATVNFQEDLKQNENLIEFFQAILDLVFRIDVNGEDKALCKTYKKTINKLIKFCLTFPYEDKSIYVDLLEQMQDAFRDQKPGFELVLSSSQSLFENLVQNSVSLDKDQFSALTEEQKQVVSFREGLGIGILALLGFETDNLLFKSEIVSSKQLV